MEEQKALPVDEFLKTYESKENVEEKLKACIDFMQCSLSQSGTPYFKGFWEVRKLCFPLFKEPIAGPVRSELWEMYIELTREGRRLKNLLDEESSFAATQIDLAVKVLEEEVAEGKPDTTLSLPTPKALQRQQAIFQEKQQILSASNLFASRINSLRKELIKTEMRIRQKNQFFERLSKLGDQIFPKRKALIKEVSDAFAEAVEQFAQEYFGESFDADQMRRSVFFYREEIKSLQAFAKALTLNTHAFTATRAQLSHCWDMLKGMEKELKKEHAEQRQKSGENREAVQAKIDEIVSQYSDKSLSDQEASKELNEVLKGMRDIDLTHGDVVGLKQAVKEARAPIEAAVEEQSMAAEKARKEKAEAFYQQLEVLIQSVSEKEVDVLTSDLEAKRQEMATVQLSKMEKQQCEQQIKKIRELIGDKKEQALLALSDDDRHALDQLKQVLIERKEQRKGIKNQLEEYRKLLGGSSLDFEKAMTYNELVTEAKESLEKCDTSVVEIEKKIEEIQNKT